MTTMMGGGEEEDDEAGRVVVMRKEAIVGLVDGYACAGDSDGGAIGGEGGVRGLEKALGRIVRGKVVEFARSLGTGTSSGSGGVELKENKYNPIVELGDLEKYLGLPRYKWEEVVGLDCDDDDGNKLGRGRGKRGVVFGLVVSGVGEGGVLPVESVFVPAGTLGEGRSGGGGIILTGMLGDVSSFLFLFLFFLI